MSRESGPCLCGDTQCPSCGTAQGTYGLEDEPMNALSRADLTILVACLLRAHDAQPLDGTEDDAKATASCARQASALVDRLCAVVEGAPVK